MVEAGRRVFGNLLRTEIVYVFVCCQAIDNKRAQTVCIFIIKYMYCKSENNMPGKKTLTILLHAVCRRLKYGYC